MTSTYLTGPNTLFNIKIVVISCNMILTIIGNDLQTIHSKLTVHC